MKLDGSIAAVITGGASGLGEATARAFAGRGARVAIFDRDSDRGKRVASEIGGVYCHVDVTSETDVEEGFETARTAHGQERILVNCAGVGIIGKTVSRDKEAGYPKRYPVTQFELAIQVNLIGTFRCVANSAFGMVSLDPLDDGERGIIINTASVAAQDGQIGQVAYAASKAGVMGMGLPMARDLMNDGVRVNTILPGIFSTPMAMALPETVIQTLAAGVPFPKRLGKPEEFASMVIFMVENLYLNAEYVRPDGGIRMAPR